MKTLVLAALLSAPAALAEAPPFHATIGVSSQLFSARGYDLVDLDDAFVSFRAAGGVTFEFGRIALDLEGAFSTGSAGATAHTQVGATLGLNGLELAGIARWRPLTWLHPYMRLGAGVDWATLTLFDGSRLTQTVANLAGHAGLGVQVSARLSQEGRRGVFLFADLGVGGVLRPAYGFEALAPAPPTGPQADPIGSRGAVKLGPLPLSGMTLRASVGVRF